MRRMGALGEFMGLEDTKYKLSKCFRIVLTRVVTSCRNLYPLERQIFAAKF